jgi:MATE family multidrug resistance protein
MPDPVVPEGSLRVEAGRVWRLAWPNSVGMLGLMGMSVVDTLMVGHLGKAPMASVALGASWLFGLNVFALGMLRALDPVIAQAHGAGDRPAMEAGAVRGVVMALLLSVPMTALQALAVPGLRVLGQPEPLLPLAGRWCAVVAWGIPGMFAFTALRQTLQAMGNMRPATVAIVLANVSNLLGNVLFIYVLGLGAVGSALSTAIGQYIVLALTAWLARDTLAPLLRRWRAGLSWRPVLALFVIGLPLGLQMAMEAWAFHLSGVMMGWIGPTEIAANAVVSNLATLSFMVPMGVGAAAATRVGNLVGSGSRWTTAARAALLLGGGLMAGSATAFALAPGLLGRLYTSDPGVIAVVITLLPVVAAFQLFDGLQVVAFGVLRGAGDLRLPSLANLLGYWVLGLPLGWWLAFRGGWGAPGILTGLCAGVATVSLLLLARIRWTATRGALRVEAG